MCKIVNNFYPPAQSNRHGFPAAGATRRARELSAPQPNKKHPIGVFLVFQIFQQNLI